MKLVRGGRYALKCIRKSKLKESLTERVHVQTELRVLNRLSGKHPFIVDMMASFQTNSHVYILTEFVPGGELFNLINFLGSDGYTGGAFEREARFYMAEIAVALQFLHDNGILYRDLKVSLDGLILTVLNFKACKEGLVIHICDE